MRKQLTEAMVEKQAPPPTGRLEIFDSIVPALALRLTANGARSYVVRGRIKGDPTPIRLTLGDVQVMKLSEARQAASEALRKMRAGNDPRVAKRAAAEAAEQSRRNTFQAVAETFITEHVAKLRTHKQVEAEIRRYLIAPWGDRPISSITEDDVAEAIQGIVDAGKRAQARLILAYAKRLFRWAASPARPRGERLNANPAQGLTARKDFDLVAPVRKNALSTDQLRIIWTAAGQLGAPFGPYFHMLLLTGQRRNEVGDMRWSELDLVRERVWVIPAERMKMQRSHEVPLTPAMIELLTEMGEARGEGGYVFSTTFGDRPVSGFSKAKARLDRIASDMNGSPLSPWTIHDIRRAVRTGLGAIPSIPHDVRELVIGHVPPTLVQTYDLHAYREEKRQALTLWGERLTRILESSTADEGRPIEAAQ